MSPPSMNPTTLEEVQAAARGTWTSLSVELRPTEDRAGTGVIEPTRLTRDFTYNEDDSFTGVITMLVDDYGTVPLLRFEFSGGLRWGGPHPVAPGAFELDYVLDRGFGVTPLQDAATGMLNDGRPAALDPFETGVPQDILGRPFPLFDIAADQILVDHDLICFRNDLLFMGAKHVDGTPFDTPERRPHQLQIPLTRAA